MRFKMALFLSHFAHIFTQSDSLISDVKFSGEMVDIEATGRGLYDLLNEYFISRGLNFKLYTYREYNDKFFDIINEIGRRPDAGSTIVIEEIERTVEQRITTPGIAFVDDDFVDELIERTEIDAETSTSDFKLFIYCGSCATKVHSKYVQIVTDDGRKLKLSSYDLFANASACRRLSATVLSHFDKSALEWQPPIVRVPRIRSFSGCSVNVVVKSHVWLKYRNRNMYQVDQMFGGIVRLMAEVGNFSANYTIERIEYDSMMTKGYQMSGIDFKLTEAFQAGAWLTKNFEAVLTFCQARLVLAITAGELYSQYEKLLLPFDTTTWILFLTVFSLAFTVTFIGNFMPKFVRNTIYGEGIHAPALNILSIFFGIGQPRLPRKNFARIILTLFVWFCLIFRTAHQSKLFEYITSEPRRDPPRLGLEAVKQYTTLEASLLESVHRIAWQVHGTRSTEVGIMNIFSRMDQMQQKYCDTHSNGSAKTAFLFNYFEDFLPVKERCGGIGDLLEEDAYFLMGINLDRNSLFFEVFHEVMMRIVPAGIPQKFHYDISNALQLKLEKTDPRRVLTMDDLGFGFVIILFACSIAAVCFLCEVAMWPFVLKRRKISEPPPLEVDDSAEDSSLTSGWHDVSLQVTASLRKRLETGDEWSLASQARSAASSVSEESNARLVHCMTVDIDVHRTAEVESLFSSSPEVQIAANSGGKVSSRDVGCQTQPVEDESEAAETSSHQDCTKLETKLNLNKLVEWDGISMINLEN